MRRTRMRSSSSSTLVLLSGPILRRTARTLVSTPPIFPPRDRRGEVVDGVLPDVVVGGGAAQLDQAAQQRAGAGHHGGDGVEQQPVRPALPQILAAEDSGPGRDSSAGASGQLLAASAGLSPYPACTTAIACS
jgi:hypothetical protein